MSLPPRGFDLATTPIENGITLVEASAGTGKTYCLAGLVVRLLVEQKVDAIGRILVVTFTNAAADELQTRIREALRHARLVLAPEGPGQEEAAGAVEPYLEELRNRYGAAAAEPLREALLAFDDLNVATIHGFCKQVLENHAFESGLPFDPELVEDDETLLHSAAEDIWRRRLYVPGGKAELLAALAVCQGWTPATFLGDYAAMHRHPGTELLPTPPPVSRALEAFEVARQEMAPLFEPESLRLAYSRLRFKGAAAMSPARLAALFAEAAAFFDGKIAALPALGELRGAHLYKLIEPASRPALDNIEFAAACDELFVRIQEVEHALRGEILPELESRVAEIKERDAVFGFDDLLRRLHEALRDRELGGRLKSAVRQRFSVALIDEFQDTDLIQYEIFQGLFAGRPLFLIGDPKQAIYRFRGADVFAYLAAKNDAARSYTLERNWRSESGLVEAVNALFSQHRRPFVFPQIDYPQVIAAEANQQRRFEGDAGIPFTWHWLDLEEKGQRVEEEILAWLSREVVRQLSSGYELTCFYAAGGQERRKLEAGDLAILVRTNHEAMVVQEALREVGVAAILARSGDIFHSEEMAELERILAAIVDPYHAATLRAASATLTFGSNAQDLIDLGEDDHLWQARVSAFEGWRERWQRAGFMAAMQALLEERQIRQRLLVLRDGERRLTNWQHAVEVVHQAIHERQLQPTSVAAWLAAERARSRHSRDSTELRLESDARAVKIVTVHKSKGLEYEVVFCPFLWRTQRADQVPVLAHTGDRQVVYDFGSRELEHHRLLAEAERLSEDARLLYVALTRARHRCHVVWGRLGQRRRAASTALAFLLHSAQTQLELGGSAIFEASTGVDGLFDEIEGRADLWLADLEKLVRQAPMALEKIDTVDPAKAESLAAESEEEEAIHVLELPAQLAARFEPWRITSFSSLARGAAAALPEIAEHQDPSWPAPRSTAKPSGLFAFARGTRAGSALHEVLEKVDFASPGSAETEAQVRHILWRHGIAEARHHEGGETYDAARAVVDNLHLLAECGLPGKEGPFTLAEVDRRQMLIEWEFHLPLDPLSTRVLAQILAGFEDELPRGYAKRVAALGERPVRGYLKGFVDLIFAHQGRYYLSDWKSNHLGNELADYPAEALELAMVEHHYLLQYLLYSVALHRHLGASLPSYSYDEHFGGVFYFFLRGLEPGIAANLFEKATARSGLYAARPSYGLIAALDETITSRARIEAEP